MNVLVLNCGSSSLKYQLLKMDKEATLLAKGLVERIGLKRVFFRTSQKEKENMSWYRIFQIIV